MSDVIRCMAAFGLLVAAPAAFAETLEEHNANVAAWRKIEAAQGAAEEGGVQSE